MCQKRRISTSRSKHAPSIGVCSAHSSGTSLVLPRRHRVHTKMAILVTLNNGLEQWECLCLPSLRHRHARAIVGPFRCLHRDTLSHQADVNVSLLAHNVSGDFRATKIVGIVRIAALRVAVVSSSVAHNLHAAIRRVFRMEPDGTAAQPANCAVHDDLRSVCADVRVFPFEEWVFVCVVRPLHVGWIAIPCFEQVAFMRIVIIHRTNARPINTILVSYSVCCVKHGTINSRWFSSSWKILGPSLTTHLEFWIGILDMEVHGVSLLTVRDWFCGRPNIICFTINCVYPDVVLCSLLANRI